MALYRDDAVILRTQLLGEADRIVTLFCKDHGIVRAVAKGVRKTSSKFGARLEPFMVADLQLFKGRNLDIITQADTVYSFGDPISSNYASFTAANVMAEVIEKLAEDDISPSQYPLLLGALRSLASGLHTPQLILNSYLLRAMSIAGWAPNFVECVISGQPGPHEYFSVTLGGVVSAEHRAGAMRVGVDTIEHLAALLTGDWQLVVQADQATRNAASGVVAAYVQHHVGRRIKSLLLLDQIVKGS